MRTSRRLLAVLTVLVAGVGLLLVPSAAAERSARPHATRPDGVPGGGARPRDRRVAGPPHLVRDVLAAVAARRRAARGGAALERPRADPPHRVRRRWTTSTGSSPPTRPGALGDSFFVAAVNSSIEVFDLDGTTAVPRTTLDARCREPRSILHFDPKVVYDQYTDTFVIVWLGQDDAPRASEIIRARDPGRDGHHHEHVVPDDLPRRPDPRRRPQCGRTIRRSATTTRASRSRRTSSRSRVRPGASGTRRS